ncbi:Bifunctional heparan sulfate N-deacetylase/N-sulfotransferase 2-like [Oopsacas minuta]|uniref:Bifunctional heparan sulfate N-deacetylase/N-sulfotransferase 2-like n=1 Tax=Oopsacas minuta TaxID=111878 RepID=A0AAV7K7L4_9METZ|nr:Bifunctional heparan sulfate N-deacetylase/N-sulfotransferase 2-like [Oopsacas minuta]
MCPQRIHTLIPNSRIVIILRDPVERAYSWFQHQRVHRNILAQNYSFIDILENNFKNKLTRHSVDKLKSRCIEPGLYYKHILHWLKYFPNDHIIFIDGGQITKNPISAIEQVLKFVNITVRRDINSSVRFDEKKGYFCPVDMDGVSRCLGPSKGRNYQEISSEEIVFLRNVYSAPNKLLKELLIRLNRSLPDWLINT